MATIHTLSKVIAETEQAVQPITWRSSASPPARPLRHESGAAPIGHPGHADPDAAIQQQIRSAFESGVREGEAAARQALEAAVRDAIGQFAQAVTEVASCRAEVIRRAEAEIVQLSVEIARRIVHRELSVDGSALAALIKAALDKLGDQEVFRVRVHPEQQQAMRACLDELGRGSNIDVIGDPSQPRGGAIFEGSRGVLDASIETQLREIERGLADHLQERP